MDALRDRLAQAIRNQSEQWEKDLRHVIEKLHLLSPLAILARGYAIAWKMPERRVLKSARGLRERDSIEVQLHEGKIYAQVQRTEV